MVDAIKFMYWRETGRNIPINSIPISMKTNFMTTKQLSVKKVINEVPEEYRLFEQDIYPEDSISFIQE